MINENLLKKLRGKKNLLAFSAGVDSSALFFVLKEKDIDFDCAIVNYKLRSEADLEAKYALELCEKFNKKRYCLEAKLDNKNFEANARKIRYDFFEKLIAEHNYDNLLTAHQLNDWFEWFLMRAANGAGFFELCGMSEVEDRANYKLIRPFLRIPRDQIESYNERNKIKFFTDKSNSELKHTRNKFRKKWANEIIKEYANGIKQTAIYLDNDRQKFAKTAIKNFEKLYIIDRYFVGSTHAADQAIKKLGNLLTKNERKLLEDHQNFIAARKIAIGFNEKYIFIAPFIKISLPKKFKELCRIRKIPPQIRSYLFEINFDFNKIA
ncbi:MAG: tRNA lysidine(34) synthetase TilS [Helicobacteraceae bacterium]|jgi:tRNA(Ile)-lysidine synthase|nr:tRNA lysidine(34) synthetase TilS [Helicobacteraceae bacterium]